MKHSNKVVLQGMIPFAILIFFLCAAYEARSIHQAEIDPKVAKALGESSYRQTHLECLSLVASLQKSGSSAVDAATSIERIKDCQKHNDGWLSLSEKERELLITYTNIEEQSQYLRHMYPAALTVLTSDHSRTSNRYQSALSILKMEVPKSRIKKSIGPLSFLFLFGLLVMFVVFRNDPNANRIRNDGRIFGISYRGLNPFSKKDKEGR